MAFIHSPKIITDGLVLCLDAGNNKSYPGSGTTWRDLTGNNRNATLVNTPTFNSNFGGYLNFADTSLQYGFISNIGNLSVWSVEAWFRLTTVLTNKITSIVANQYDLVNKLNFSIGTNNAPTNYNLTTGFFDGNWRTVAGMVPVTNIWYHVIGTYDGTTIRQFINGQSDGGTLTYSGTPQSGGEIRLMRRWDSTAVSSNYVNGDLSIVRIYSYAMSTGQIIQNFNALRSRFGV